MTSWANDKIIRFCNILGSRYNVTNLWTSDIYKDNEFFGAQSQICQTTYHSKYSLGIKLLSQLPQSIVCLRKAQEIWQGCHSRSSGAFIFHIRVVCSFSSSLLLLDLTWLYQRLHRCIHIWSYQWRRHEKSKGYLLGSQPLCSIQLKSIVLSWECTIFVYTLHLLTPYV